VSEGQVAGSAGAMQVDPSLTRRVGIGIEAAYFRLSPSHRGVVAYNLLLLPFPNFHSLSRHAFQNRFASR
jgi:hypothetical protein